MLRLFGTKKNDSKLEKVVVYTSSLDVDHSIEDPVVLEQIMKIWSRRRKTRTSIDPTCKTVTIDFIINDRKHSGRWIYDRNGFFWVLSINKQNASMIDYVESFNQLLRI